MGKRKPKALVIAGYGLNCEEETAYAFGLAGAVSDIMHVNDLIANPKTLRSYRILAVPGGFAYGDDTGSGNAFARKLKNHLWDALLEFIARDTLVIGICNGCQILVNLGLVPAAEGAYGRRQVALLPNDSARYTVRWTDLSVQNGTPWLSGITTVSLPIAHGEGKLYADTRVAKELKQRNLVALRYVAGEISRAQSLPYNPTGTMDDIAGITDRTGRILGLMPHPERALFFTQLPQWTYLKEHYIRQGKRIPRFGPGLKIFQNAVSYFS